MEPIIKELKDERKDVNIVQIDVDKEDALAMRYFVQQLPTFVFFDAKGQEAFRHVGLMPKKDINLKLDEIKKQSTQAPAPPAKK